MEAADINPAESRLDATMVEIPDEAVRAEFEREAGSAGYGTQIARERIQSASTDVLLDEIQKRQQVQAVFR